MAEAPAILSWMQSLSDMTRARAMRLLESHELTVAELCCVLQMPQSTVSRHLKVLSDEGWLRSRREGTSRFYRMAGEELETPARRLWQLLRDQTAAGSEADRDDERLASVLAERQTQSQAFFATAAGQWDKMRGEMFGARFDLAALPALFDSEWLVADLGCGTGQVSDSIAPFVAGVIAVDHSEAMLKSARQRLARHGNVQVKRGSLDRLPIDDESLDAAIACLVLHHVPDPGAAIAEAARALRSGGRLLIVDMVSHDRSEYAQQMGHIWLGFEPDQITEWFERCGLTDARVTTLPADPAAKGPALFAATARRNGKRNGGATKRKKPRR